LSVNFKSEGEVDVIFGYWTDSDDGLLCQAVFYPELLARLSNLGVGMQIDVWRDEKEEGASD
jgi:hypothetical protein